MTCVMIKSYKDNDAVFIRLMQERCISKSLNQDRPTWGDVEKLLEILEKCDE